MSDLQFGPPPPRSPLPAILIASAVLVAAAAAVFLLNPHETAKIAVTRVRTYTARTEVQALRGTSNIIGAPARIEQDLYVLLTVKIDDKLRLPLFIKDETAVLTAPDGSVLESSALHQGDLPQVYAAFPAVAALASDPLARDTKIDPGKSVEGMVLLHFPGTTEAAWTGRKAATLTFSLFHQDPQTVLVPK